MAKRRPSGDGMVRKREDGRWEGRIVVGHKKNGTPIFQHAYAHTQKELTEKLHQNIERYQDVELTEDSRMTLGEWLDRWLTDYKENTVRPGTRGVSKLHRKLHQAAAWRQTGVAGDSAGCTETLPQAERKRAGQGASAARLCVVGHHHQPPPRHLPSGNGGCPPRAYHRQESHRGRNGAKGKPCAEACPDRQRTGHLSGRRAERQNMG